MTKGVGSWESGHLGERPYSRERQAPTTWSGRKKKRSENHAPHRAVSVVGTALSSPRELGERTFSKTTCIRESGRRRRRANDDDDDDATDERRSTQPQWHQVCVDSRRPQHPPPRPSLLPRTRHSSVVSNHLPERSVRRHFSFDQTFPSSPDTQKNKKFYASHVKMT